MALLKMRNGTTLHHKLTLHALARAILVATVVAILAGRYRSSGGRFGMTLAFSHRSCDLLLLISREVIVRRKQR